MRSIFLPKSSRDFFFLNASMMSSLLDVNRTVMTATPSR